MKKFRFRKNHFLLFAIVFSFISVTNIFPVVAQSDYSQLIVQNKITPNTLVEQGKSFYDKGDFSEAIQKLKEAKEIFKIRGDKLNISMISSNLSLAYQQIGEWNNAENEITESINLLKSINDNSKDKLKLLASALEIQGKLQLSVGKPKQALIAWQDAANKFEQAEIQGGEVRSKINQSLALQEIGRYREAYKILAGLVSVLPQQSISIQATAYRVIGNAIREAGLVEDEEDKEKLLSLLLVEEDLKETDKLQRLKYQLQMNSFLELNYIEISRKFLQQSLNIYEELNSKQPASTQLKQDIAETYFSLGNTERAAYYRAKDAYERVTTSGKNDYDKQLKFLNNAVNNYQKSESNNNSIPVTKIQAQLKQLDLLIDLNKRLQTNEIYEDYIEDKKSLASLQKTFNHLLKNTSLIKDEIDGLQNSRISVYAAINLSQLLIEVPKKFKIQLGELSNLKLINEYLNKAVQKAHRLGDKRTEAYALYNFAQLEEKTEAYTEAYNHTKKALQLADNIQAFDITYKLQAQLGSILVKLGDNKAALASYQESVNTIKTLRQDLVGLYSPDFTFLFRDKIEPIYLSLIQLLLPYPGDSINRAKSRNDYSSILDQNSIKDAIQTVQNLQVLELESFLRCSLQNPTSIAIDKITEEEDPEAAVIYPILLDNRLEVLLKLPNQKSIKRYTNITVSKEDVEDTVESLKDIISNKNSNNYYSEFESYSTKLYNWLFRQNGQQNSLEKELENNNIKTLVFVLGSHSAALRNTPMAALYDSKQYLIEKGYRIVLNLGTELLQTKPLNRKKPSILAVGISEKYKQWKALPHVKKELDNIDNISGSEVLLNKKFTPKNLKKFVDSQPFKIVHFATHGLFSSSFDDTFILAYQKVINLNQLKFLLRSQQEKQTNPIDLLVFSACQTANGDTRATLGIAGVSVQVGARSTIASLSDVPDRPTYELIKTFYEELFNEQKDTTISEALRIAQVNSLKNYRESPSSWASFVLVGNWR